MKRWLSEGGDRGQVDKKLKGRGETNHKTTYHRRDSLQEGTVGSLCHLGELGDDRVVNILLVECIVNAALQSVY